MQKQLETVWKQMCDLVQLNFTYGHEMEVVTFTRYKTFFQLFKNTIIILSMQIILRQKTGQI